MQVEAPMGLPVGEPARAVGQVVPASQTLSTVPLHLLATVLLRVAMMQPPAMDPNATGLLGTALASGRAAHAGPH